MNLGEVAVVCGRRAHRLLPLSWKYFPLKLQSLKSTLNKYKVRAPLMALVTIFPVTCFLRAALAQRCASVGNPASASLKSSPCKKKKKVSLQRLKETQIGRARWVSLSPLRFCGLSDNAKEVVVHRLIFTESS